MEGSSSKTIMQTPITWIFKLWAKDENHDTFYIFVVMAQVKKLKHWIEMAVAIPAPPVPPRSTTAILLEFFFFLFVFDWWENVISLWEKKKNQDYAKCGWLMSNDQVFCSICPALFLNELVHDKLFNVKNVPLSISLWYIGDKLNWNVFKSLEIKKQLFKFYVGTKK